MRHFAAVLALTLCACGSRSDPPLTDEALLGARTGAGQKPDGPIRAGEAGDRGSAVARDACSGDPIETGPGWADRLPAAFPLYPGSRVIKAGGVERGCGLRIVSFRTDAARSAVLDWWSAAARASNCWRTPGADRRLARREPPVRNLAATLLTDGGHAVPPPPSRAHS